MMKIETSLAISKDGYIADKDGGVGFLDKFNDPNSDKYKKLMKHFNKFLNSVDVLLIGETAYLQMEGWGGFPWTGKNIDIFVLSKKDIKGDRVTSCTCSPTEFVAKFKNKYKRLFIFGGAYTLKGYLESNLVDKFYYSEVDVELKEGIYLSTKNELENNYNMKLKKKYKFDGITENIYVKK